MWLLHSKLWLLITLPSLLPSSLLCIWNIPLPLFLRIHVIAFRTYLDNLGDPPHLKILILIISFTHKVIKCLGIKAWYPWGTLFSLPQVGIAFIAGIYVVIHHYHIWHWSKPLHILTQLILKTILMLSQLLSSLLVEKTKGKRSKITTCPSSRFKTWALWLWESLHSTAF